MLFSIDLCLAKACSLKSLILGCTLASYRSPLLDTDVLLQVDEQDLEILLVQLALDLGHEVRIQDRDSHVGQHRGHQVEGVALQLSERRRCQARHRHLGDQIRLLSRSLTVSLSKVK